MPLWVSQILTGNDNIFKQSSNISPQSNSNYSKWIRFLDINNSRCLQSQQAVQFFFSSDNRNKKNLKFQTQRNWNRFKSQRSKRNLLYSRQMLNNNNQTLISMLENNSELNKTGEITNQNNEDIDKYKAWDIDKDILKLYYSNLS